jgi:phosphatidylserine/phosphatidylglycerophosphate/cardiolipin synthase-like enzyme
MSNKILSNANEVTVHNKVMVLDNEVVITGSFNFTNSAETRNAENLLILKSQDLAARYKTQWLAHWTHSKDAAF